MKPVVVLAYDGAFDARGAVAALAAAHAAEVVTLTLDIGQSRDVQEMRDAALDAGAVRAHVFDALDEFARLCVLPALRAPAPVRPSLAGSAALAYPLIARRLVEIAQIECARIVAHGDGEELSAAIRALDPALRVATIDTAAFACAEQGPRAGHAARHLLQRPVADPANGRGLGAILEIAFDDAVPVAVNGVSLSLPELVECLSVIAGQHGVGHADGSRVPGALVLETAYRVLAHPAGIVRIELLEGRQHVRPAGAPRPELVNHA